MGCRYVFGNRYFRITDGPAEDEEDEEGYVDGAGYSDGRLYTLCRISILQCDHGMMTREIGHTASAPCLISSASSSIARAGALNLDGPASDDIFS